MKKAGETCVRCGVWITWSTRNGVRFQTHEGNVPCIPNIYNADGKPIECPDCHQQKYSVQYRGKVWFVDKIGKPWRKHVGPKESSTVVSRIDAPKQMVPPPVASAKVDSQPKLTKPAWETLQELRSIPQKTRDGNSELFGGKVKEVAGQPVGQTRGPGKIPIPPKVIVRGVGGVSRNVILADLSRLPQQRVLITLSGVKRTVEGVLVWDVLAEMGSLSGKKAASLYLLVEGTNNRRVLFACGEFAPEIAGKRVLLIWKRDGMRLPKNDGPFQVIAPDDLTDTRWVRGVTSLKIKQGG